MAKLELDTARFDAYLRRLAELQHNCEPVLKASVYEGARVATDEMRKTIVALPVHQKGAPGGVREYEKEALLEGLGITPMSWDDDFLNVKLGFDGYYKPPEVELRAMRREMGSKERARREKGIPTVVVARSIESGTSFSQKVPFVRPTVNRVRRTVVAEMQRELEKQIENRMKR
ncbi:MAG: hypothetical protein IJB67_01770 [Firmicutes bacterium]|nr:hypothetical protein [Bacillota bacterium]